ncbi:MAG: HAD family phosphatase [Clostridia bacterium]|nr:HAD family phosphatase [Clostridia bacterium]
MIQNLIFDFGNVIIRFDPEYIVSQTVSDPEERAILTDAIFEQKRFESYDIGLFSPEEHKEHTRRLLPEALHEKSDKILDTWYKYLPVICGMDNIVRDAKKAGYGVYILSNINREFLENRHKVEVLSLFDGARFSSEIHHIKPDPVIYQSLLDEYHLKAEECLFIDDRQININGGEALGIKGYLFDGDSKKLREFINTSEDMAYKIG